MRFHLATLSILALASGGYGQVPVVSITGQPFSADEVIIQNPKPNVHNVLPMKTIRIYRDSAGRTREDASIPRDLTATPFVSIIDPIAGVHYALDTEKKLDDSPLAPDDAAKQVRRQLEDLASRHTATVRKTTANPVQGTSHDSAECNRSPAPTRAQKLATEATLALLAK